MLFARVAEVSAAVGATRSRKEKGELLAALLSQLEPDEVEIAVGYLIGSPRQGALGVGWATVSKIEVPDVAEPTLSILDIDHLLDEIVATSGSGSNQARLDLLSATLGRATSGEQEFLARLLIGDLRQGALAGVVTDAVAKAAGVKLKLMRRAVMLQGDLGQAAAIALTRGEAGLGAIDLEVGRPIQPMLASTAASVSEALESLGEAQVEWKLDGARVQVHKEGDQVSVYTRNLNDVTARLPQVCDLVRSFGCSSVVLDGEVIGFMGEDESPQPFQDTMSAFGTEEDETPARGLRSFFFDVMYLDGISLIETPLAERSAILERLVGSAGIPRITTTDPAEGEEQLARALEQGHEGVMVKGATSGYEAGRRGKTWRKVKPVHTLDLVILAAEWGHGRRQGWLSNLHLGARDPETGAFVMVGKTFKGLTDELLEWQTTQFLASKTHETQGGHTVWVRPEFVVEIALDGAQRSTRYPGGVALRFARVKGYRPDRDPHTADTLDEVRKLL